jgi:ribosomal protein L7/L12
MTDDNRATHEPLEDKDMQTAVKVQINGNECVVIGDTTYQVVEPESLLTNKYELEMLGELMQFGSDTPFKIKVIKVVRALKNCGIKEAKDIVELAMALRGQRLAA